MYRTVLLALFLTGCPHGADREAPSPNPIEPPDTEMCGAMCEHFRALKCEEGSPYYDSDLPGPKNVPNASCEHFCQVQQKNGVYVNPRCGAVVPACPDIEAWRKKDCR